jgi:TPR repeat protein
MTCEGGNWEACYKDGMAAISAARPRYSKARKSFSEACMNTHHAEACKELAVLVRDAKGGPKDLPRAADMFSIACKGGVDTACVDLGLALYQGAGIKEQPSRAVELFDNACSAEQPLARACNALGTAYEEGKGVDKERADKDKAAELYIKACDLKFAPGCVEGGDLAASYKRRDKTAEAADLYARACKIDARHGCFELAELHEGKSWPDASDDKAAQFYQKVCNIDPPRGCFEAGSLMESGRVQARDGEIEYLYNLACEHGHTEACTKRTLE